MRRELHAAVLGLVGATLLRLALTGAYTRYVRVGLRPFLLAAGGVLVVVAAASMWQTLVARRRPFAGADAHHGHVHRGLDVSWLLVVPMLVVLLLAPVSLGSYSASRSGTALGATAQQVSQLPPLPDGDPVRLSVLEYASRAVFDDGRSLTGRQVTLSGFLLSSGHDGWYLTRMVIGCCAADARPVKIGLSGAVPAGAGPNDWWQVTGGFVATVDKDPVNGERIPYLEVTAANPIAAPAQQYVS
jgi:uncharacterized repeat protein (TIGR03943 family)